MSIKLSIIVPVYNAEKHLHNSLNSLVKQALENYEVILIDDGSTDNSKKILDSFQKEYPDIIRVIHTENKGAANARNIGLDLATGEYVGFFDSDDFVAVDMYDKLYRLAKKENADIAVCGYYIVSNTNIRSFQNGNTDQYGKSIYENPSIFIYGVPYLWNKIFKRSMIVDNNIRFNKLRIFEDLDFTYRLYFLANKIVKYDQPLYYYMRIGEETLTSEFNERFFDIIPAIKSLVDFTKGKNSYDDFKDYILYTCLNHMYLRMNVPIKPSNLMLKYKYIDECFAYLDSEFPSWKQHRIYFEYKKHNKTLYTSKLYWKIVSLFLKPRRLLAKNLRRLIKIAKIAFKPRIGSKYIKFVRNLSINDHYILLDSQHGNDLNGNMFYLLKELQDDSYKDFRIYLSVTQNRYEEFENKIRNYEFNRVNLIIYNSSEYAKVLAISKYLFNDTSFPPYFVKRNGQIYLNTWHGTPLKTLGKKTKEDFYNICNLQKNFNSADFLLYPNKYMMDHMIEDYMISNISENKIMLCGYPRNTVFFDTRRRAELREKLKIDDKFIIVYMPTWRGTLNNKNDASYIVDLEEKLSEISKRLKPDQLLFLNVHPYLKDHIKVNGYSNILLFPKEYETYDFLNCADVLITDYSSVFYDFACTKRKIILFAYDKEDYWKERGLYVKFDELPFPMVETVDELIKEINSPSVISYHDFNTEYNSYDHSKAAKDICKFLILNEKQSLEIVRMPNNQKDNILCVARNLMILSINKTFFSLVSNSNLDSNNYYLTFVNSSFYRHKKLLWYLPEKFSYYGQLYRYPLASICDCLLLALCSKSNFIFKRFKNKLSSIFSTEYARIFNNINFKYHILIGENKARRIALFANKKSNILYYPKESLFNKKIPSYILNRYDLIVFENKKDYEYVLNLLQPNTTIKLVNHVNSFDELISYLPNHEHEA